MKVSILREREGWLLVADGFKSDPPVASYPAALRLAAAEGHEVDNAGWLQRLLMWNFNSHSLDGYPEWELEHIAGERDAPAFVKLTHVRGTGPVESHALAAAWDDVAKVSFYQRDWTDDGIPSVSKDETYWSGWWFATIAERDRFVQWHADRPILYFIDGLQTRHVQGWYGPECARIRRTWKKLRWARQRADRRSRRLEKR